MNSTLEMQAVGDEPRILVIQSNRTYLGVVARRLKEFGYRAATAETAAAGLAEMYRIPVDLVLCDVNLAGTTGIEFARMVREDPVNRNVPLLLVVGRSDAAKRLINDNAMLDARVVERAIQIGELRDQLAQVRATAVG